MRWLRLIDEQQVYRRHVKGRRLIYLDSNVWIDLTNGRTRDARACLAGCRTLHDSGAALFPLSSASIGELLEQGRGQAQSTRAKLMDELSELVTFRGHHEIAMVEAAAAFPVAFDEPAQTLEVSRLFTYVIERWGDSFQPVPAHLTDVGAQQFAVAIRGNAAAVSVARLLDILDLDEHRARHEAVADRHRERHSTSVFRAYENTRNQDGKPNWRRAHLQEQLAMFQSYALPALEAYAKSGAGQEVQARIIAARGDPGPGSEKRLASLMEAMPAIGLIAELHAQRTRNPRASVPWQDFWDCEHGGIAPAYCDAVVTERGLASVLEKCAAPKRRGCQILRGVPGLLGWIQAGMPPRQGVQ